MFVYLQFKKFTEFFLNAVVAVSRRESYTAKFMIQAILILKIR